MDLSSFIQEYWEIGLIPFISAFVGWFTNVVAVKMMFYPTEFVGIRPYLGWQGIVPANAERLGQFSTRLITTKLLSLTDLFAGFDAGHFGAHIERTIDDVTEQVIDEIATKHAPEMWENAGEFMQNKVRETIREEVHEVAILIASDLSENITEILDLEKVVVDAVMRDRKLMSQMFLEVGSEEFKFIERSGIWFGFAFGLVQMAMWIIYDMWWILPFFGFLVGYATNWLAIKLIFEPKEPTRYGPFVVQGLFHKRQHEVSTRFADLVAARVFNADNIVDTVTQGETGKRVEIIVKERVGELIDKYEAHPMATIVLPNEEDRRALRESVMARVHEEMPKPGGLLHVFADKAVDIRRSLEERMKNLDSESFEGVLRPAFQQDEWKLILAGAVLGLGAGFAQLIYLFGESVTWID